MNKVKHILPFLLASAMVVFIAGCGAGNKEDANKELAAKKEQLEKLKGEQAVLNTKISALQEEIYKLDPDAEMSKAKLVTLESIGTNDFSHYIDLQGTIDPVNYAFVAPQGAGGVVKALYVKQGQRVNKGQLLLKLDDAVARQAVVAAQEQVGGVKAQLSQAETIYEKQQNLWKNNIGTEVQVLNAKTAVETLRSQLQAVEAQVRMAQEQANMSNVYAPISGVAENVSVKIGEFFSPQSSSMGAGIAVVNTGELKLLVKVPEKYIGRVQVGTPLRVTLPELDNKVFEAKANVVSSYIDPVSRTFYIEAKVPADKSYRANQIAQVQIMDYSSTNAVTIPVNTLQTDEKGKYVLVAVSENGKWIVRKKAVVIGELYRDRLEIKSGLETGDQIIVEGFQNLYEGQLITTGTK